jgi:hypothetical protein
MSGPPNQRLKIDGAAFVLTLDGERRIIRDGSLLIRGSRIERVGKAADLADGPIGRSPAPFPPVHPAAWRATMKTQPGRRVERGERDGGRAAADQL